MLEIPSLFLLMPFVLKPCSTQIFYYDVDIKFERIFIHNFLNVHHLTKNNFYLAVIFIIISI